MALTVCSDPRLFREGQLTGPWAVNHPPRDGRSSISGSAVDLVYVNGIWTSAEMHQERAQQIAGKYTGRTVVGIYNPSAVYDAQASLPGSLSRRTSSFVEQITRQHLPSAMETAGMQSFVLAGELMKRTQLPTTLAVDGLTDIAQTAGDALGVSNDEAVANIAEIIRSNPKVHLIGHSQGSEIIVSALWKVKHENPSFDLSGVKADLIGTQSVYMPKGPAYLKVVDRSDIFATPIQPVIGLLQQLGHFSTVVAGDYDRTPVHIANIGTGHDSQWYIENLEAIREGEKDLRTMSVEESAMGLATAETLAWFVYDRGKDLVHKVHEKFTPIINRVQAFANKASRLVRPLVHALVHTASGIVSRTRHLTQRTVEKGKKAALLAARWTASKVTKAKEWAVDKTQKAWKWGSEKALTTWERITGRLRGIGGAAVERAVETARWTVNRVSDAARWTAVRAQRAINWTRGRARDVRAGARSAWNWASDRTQSAWDWAGDRARDVRQGVRGIGSFVGDRARDLLRGVRAAGPWQIARRIAGMTTLGRVVSAIGGVASGIRTVARTIGSVVRPLAGQVINRVGAFARPIGVAVQRTVQQVADRLRPITRPISAAMHRVGGVISRTVQRVGAFAGNTVRRATQTTGQLAGRVLATVASGVRQTVQNVGQRVSRVASLPSRIANRAAEMTRPVTSGIRRVLSGFGGWLTGRREQVQHSGDGHHPEVNPLLLRNSLLSQEGTGSAPVPEMRPALQHAVGFDTGIARLHRGPAAASAARMLNAEAFTIGRDVFFGHGRYDPVTPQGRGLIAHELTHVAQQTGAAGDRTLRYATHEGGNAMEVEAQHSRRRMVLASQVGSRQGLFVDEYVRHYEAETGALSEVDVERLNRISLEALRQAEARAQREAMTLAHPLDVLDVDVSLDLEKMSDEEAAALWASAIISRLRFRTKSLSKPTVPSPRRPSPMLARSPIQFEPTEPALEEKNSQTEKTLDEIEGHVGFWWVSPGLEWKIENLWNSFDDLPGIVRRNPRAKDLFVKSINKGAEIDNIAQAAPLTAEFKSAVKQVALNYMARNYISVQAEMVRLGLSPGRDTDGRAAQQRADTHMALVKQMAAQVAQLQSMQAQLREIVVGRNASYRRAYGDYIEHYTPVKFDPDSPPQYSAEPGSDQVPYSQVKAQWDLLAQGISMVANKNPGVYAMIRDGKIGEVANGSVYQARETLRAGFTDMLANITEATGKIMHDKLDHRELLPIHQQMFANRVQGGDGAQYNWSDPFKQAVGQGIVSDFQDAEFWKSLGLASLGAALFVVAEVASGGLATAALVGAGGLTVATVGTSLTHYLDMAGAAKTAVSDDTSLVEQRQVDSARLDLILNSVGAFLDWAGPAAKLVKGVRAATAVRAAAAGARGELVEELGKLAAMSADDLGKLETRQLLEQSLSELGVDEVVRRTGMSKEKLAGILGPASDLGKRILGFSGSKGVLDNLANVKAGTLPREEAEQLVLQAIDQLGAADALKRTGGWKKLSSLLGNDSAAGKQLIAWRQSIYQDLEEFIGAQNIKRTGTASKFTNDMDISLLGIEANSDVLRARQFLASRAGVGPDEIEDLLYASFFSDPRRMHLYATLSPELASRLTTRRAAFETELIWSRRISLAEGSMRQSLIDQANRMGVNWTRFRDLSVKDLQMLKRDVDELYKALGSAREVTEQTKLIDAIAEKQALINATEGGGYFSGGGVQRWVSERDQFPGYKPEEPKAWTPAHAAGNVMDQFAKLDEAYAHLQPLLHEAQAHAKVADVAAALKSIGKYGDRLVSGAKSALGVELSSGSLGECAEYFAKLMVDEKSGALLASRLATPERIMQEMVTAERALFRIQQSSDGLLMELMQRANLARVSGDFKTIQAATQNQLLLRQVTNGIMEHIHALGVRALNALGKGQPQPGQ
ncbi:MAG: eCIS core domain-containing protein [Armatimonadota bacterium]